MMTQQGDELEAENAKLLAIAEAAWNFCRECFDRNPSPDLALRANWRAELYRLLDEWKGGKR